MNEQKLGITPEQVQAVQTFQARVNAAQRELDLVLFGIMAGHGITSGRVTQVDAEKNELTVQVRGLSAV